MALSLVTAAQGDLITLAEAKAHLRVDHNDEDGLINGLIAAARDRAEAVTGRQFLQATWDLKRDAFPCEYQIQIPKPPLVSVTYVKYIDTAGVLQTWDPTNYQVSAPAGPFAERGRLQTAYGVNWPSSRSDTVDAVIVRFIAGFGTAAATVPAAIRQAMLLMMGAWYDQRQDLVADHGQTPLGALALLTPYKVYA